MSEKIFLQEIQIKRDKHKPVVFTGAKICHFNTGRFGALSYKNVIVYQTKSKKYVLHISTPERQRFHDIVQFQLDGWGAPWTPSDNALNNPNHEYEEVTIFETFDELMAFLRAQIELEANKALSKDGSDREDVEIID
jgi:EXLDI family protein